METATAPKVRLVRCPKCLLVLPEVADFPVYKCGGCDTILVAKKRKDIAKSTSVLQETESVRVFEHGESSSSTLQEVLLPSPLESRSSQESGGDWHVSTGSHTEELGEGLSVQGQPNGHYEKDQNTSRDSDGDGACDVLDENRSTDSQGEESSVEGELNGPYKKDQHTSRYSDGDGDGESDRDMLDDNRSNKGRQKGTRVLQTESLEHCNVQQPGVSFEGSLSIEAEANDMALQLETSNKIDSHTQGSRRGEHRGVNSVRSTETFGTSDFVSLQSELSEPTECVSKSTTVTSSHASVSSFSSSDGMDYHFPDQQSPFFENDYKPSGLLEPPRNRPRQERDQNSFPIPLPRRARKYSSTIPLPQWDSLRSKDSAGPSRETRDKSLELPRNRSRPVPLPQRAAFHSNEGAGPSCEVQDEPLVPPRNRSRPVPLPQRASLHSNESAGPAHEMRNEPLDPPRNRSRAVPLPQRASLHSNESAGPSHELRDEPFELPRNWPRPAPLPLRSSLRGNESAGPSRELRDEFPFDPTFNRFEKAEYGDHEENMKLLKMVYELQDQISKTCHLNGRTPPDEPWKQSHFDTYNHQEEPPEYENFHPAYYRTRDPSWQSRISRVPFSGGAINRGFCRGGADHSCYKSYSSCPTSPQRYLDSDFSNWTHETKSDDQRYRDHELKRYLREKHHSVRRHIRPTAGGAPFVTCYHCIRPLQLPADFLVFERRFHQLRCGGCSKVLKFSVREGTHIVPYEVVNTVPPPSEVEDVRILGSASSSSVETDPLSYSDEYGHSFDISSSSKPMETFDSVGPSGSKRVSSEIEGSPHRTRVSPLHRLMGYSTLSQVLRRHKPSTTDTSSFQSGKN